MKKYLLSLSLIALANPAMAATGFNDLQLGLLIAVNLATAGAICFGCLVLATVYFDHRKQKRRALRISHQAPENRRPSTQRRPRTRLQQQF